MISRIDHVSIAVNDYEKARYFFQDILGAIPGFDDKDTDLNFFWQIFSLGDLSRIEILEPGAERSFLDNFLKRNKAGGVHHITLQTPDIHQAKKTLEENNIPYFGFNEYEDQYWKEIFIHPKDAFGVLIQIAEFNSDDWLDESVKLADKRWSVNKDDRGYHLCFSHPGGGTIKQVLSEKEVKLLVSDLQEVLQPTG